LGAIQTLRGELDTWLKEATKSLKELEKNPKPTQLKWAEPGSTQKRKIDELYEKQDLNSLKGVIDFVKSRIANTKDNRVKTLQGIYNRLKTVADQNKDV
jgi:hypothetical protein